MSEVPVLSDSHSAGQTAGSRYLRVRSELDEVCRRAGRDPRSVRLIAVSKTAGIDDIVSARDAGAHDFGENRPDPLMQKFAALPQENWHFIGNIQSRRIRDIVGRATLVHSLFDADHARKIDLAAQRAELVQDVLLEVNVSGEESKSGCTPRQTLELLELCTSLDHVRVRGLMTMAPRGDAEVARKVFEGLRALHENLQAQLPADKAQVFNELSMGMSEDWREAVFAGATMIRVGRAIFSDQFER